MEYLAIIVLIPLAVLFGFLIRTGMQQKDPDGIVLGYVLGFVVVVLPLLVILS